MDRVEVRHPRRGELSRPVTDLPVEGDACGFAQDPAAKRLLDLDGATNRVLTGGGSTGVPERAEQNR
jgi:hypothetical protein